MGKSHERGIKGVGVLLCYVLMFVMVSFSFHMFSCIVPEWIELNGFTSLAEIQSVYLPTAQANKQFCAAGSTTDCFSSVGSQYYYDVIPAGTFNTVSGSYKSGLWEACMDFSATSTTPATVSQTGCSSLTFDFLPSNGDGCADGTKVAVNMVKAFIIIAIVLLFILMCVLGALLMQDPYPDNGVSANRMVPKLLCFVACLMLFTFFCDVIIVLLVLFFYTEINCSDFIGGGYNPFRCPSCSWGLAWWLMLSAAVLDGVTLCMLVYALLWALRVHIKHLHRYVEVPPELMTDDDVVSLYNMPLPEPIPTQPLPIQYPVVQDQPMVYTSIPPQYPSAQAPPVMMGGPITPIESPITSPRGFNAHPADPFMPASGRWVNQWVDDHGIEPYGTLTRTPMPVGTHVPPPSPMIMPPSGYTTPYNLDPNQFLTPLTPTPVGQHLAPPQPLTSAPGQVLESSTHVPFSPTVEPLRFADPAMQPFGTPGLGTPGLGTPGLGTPGLGTSGFGTPGTSTPLQPVSSFPEPFNASAFPPAPSQPPMPPLPQGDAFQPPLNQDAQIQFLQQNLRQQQKLQAQLHRQLQQQQQMPLM